MSHSRGAYPQVCLGIRWPKPFIPVACRVLYSKITLAFFYIALYMNYILFKFKFGGGQRKCSMKLCCSECRAVRADQVHLNVQSLHRGNSELGLSRKDQRIEELLNLPEWPQLSFSYLSPLSDSRL